MYLLDRSSGDIAVGHLSSNRRSMGKSGNRTTPPESPAINPLPKGSLTCPPKAVGALQTDHPCDRRYTSGSPRSPGRCAMACPSTPKETLVNRIVYIVGAVVIIIALLSFFGLR